MIFSVCGTILGKRYEIPPDARNWPRNPTNFIENSLQEAREANLRLRFRSTRPGYFAFLGAMFAQESKEGMVGAVAGTVGGGGGAIYGLVAGGIALAPIIGPVFAVGGMIAAAVVAVPYGMALGLGTGAIAGAAVNETLDPLAMNDLEKRRSERAA